MEIEQLKGLRELVLSEMRYFVPPDDTALTPAGEDLLALIDDEIARQSVTDKYPNAGIDPDADDWGNGYSRGYADGLQSQMKPAEPDVDFTADDESIANEKIDARSETLPYDLIEMKQVEPYQSSFQCSKCGASMNFEFNTKNYGKHCPNCGSKLRDGE